MNNETSDESDYSSEEEFESEEEEETTDEEGTDGDTDEETTPTPSPGRPISQQQKTETLKRSEPLNQDTSERKVRWSVEDVLEEEEKLNPAEIMSRGIKQMQNTIRQRNTTLQEIQQNNDTLKKDCEKLQKLNNQLLQKATALEQEIANAKRSKNRWLLIMGTTVTVILAISFFGFSK